MLYRASISRLLVLAGGFEHHSVELASAYHLSDAIELGAGAIVGEVRFIAEGPRPATARAVTDVTVLAWDVSVWRSIAEQHPAVG